MVPVLIPLVVNSVIRSGELAEAMESRAYGAVSKPTSLHSYSSTKRDKLVAAGSLILFIITVYIYVRFPTPLLWYPLGVVPERGRRAGVVRKDIPTPTDGSTSAKFPSGDFVLTPGVPLQVR